MCNNSRVNFFFFFKYLKEIYLQFPFYFRLLPVEYNQLEDFVPLLMKRLEAAWVEEDRHDLALSIQLVQ